VFAQDVTARAECGGPMRWLEVATTAEAIARLLAEHELDAEHRAGPRRRPVLRAPPPRQLALRFGP